MDTILALIFHAEVTISVCLNTVCLNIFKQVRKSDKHATAILSLLYYYTVLLLQ